MNKVINRYNLLLLVLLSLSIASCTQDNVHMPETEVESWETTTLTQSGHLTTTVPAVQEYLQGPIVEEMMLKVENISTKHSGHVVVCVESFSINDPFVVDLLKKSIEIGAMRIEGVEYAAYPSGGGYLKKDAFEVQAGEYTTRGSLYGEITKEGRLTLTLKYRPGTMPFDVVSQFKLVVDLCRGMMKDNI